MNSSITYWLVLHPDLKQPVGGVKQMHRFGEALNKCGRRAYVIQDRSDFHPGWFHSKLKTTSFQDFKKQWDFLSPQENIVVLPETFILDLDVYAPRLPKIIFNQNGSYSFGSPGSKFKLPPQSIIELYRRSDILHILCVSDFDKMLLIDGFNLGQDRVSRLYNCIDTNVFFPGQHKKRQISYMPRKNTLDVDVVLALLQLRSCFSDWYFQPIINCTQEQVARHLRQSLIYLSFGHPEGFGLPLAEAMASGCALVGYSGLGGREIFTLGSQYGVATEIPFGDWLGFINSCYSFSLLLKADKANLFNNLLLASKAVHSSYSFESMRHSVEIALGRWEQLLQAW
ncbi:glycosyltransferase family 4 protein [Synechococcus sp. GEYO]|uniref:glycosyltransferase family 4 protein n=1 Tax=Synechococcus sp. GEYO TaxID=2575511 RepID=UPI0010BD8E94|nr:glycosyltransferase family 4 protein [Synechococcus sp. GEYO]